LTIFLSSLKAKATLPQAASMLWRFDMSWRKASLLHVEGRANGIK
jgi:hypothetical protein